MVEYVNLPGSHEGGPNGTQAWDILDSTGSSCTGIDGSGPAVGGLNPASTDAVLRGRRY